jgi:hypothetical protein
MFAPALRVRTTLGSDKAHEYRAPTAQLVLNLVHVDSRLIRQVQPERKARGGSQR